MDSRIEWASVCVLFVADRTCYLMLEGLTFCLLVLLFRLSISDVQVKTPDGCLTEQVMLRVCILRAPAQDNRVDYAEPLIRGELL